MLEIKGEIQGCEQVKDEDIRRVLCRIYPTGSGKQLRIPKRMKSGSAIKICEFNQIVGVV